MKFFDTVKVENVELIIGDEKLSITVSAALNSSNKNYYDFQKTIKNKYTCVVKKDTGCVRFITEDASTIAPSAGERVFGIDEYDADIEFDGTWKFDDKTLEFYQDAEILAANILRANSIQYSPLIEKAASAISAIENSAAIGRPREGDAEKLETLRFYLEDLRDVDLTVKQPNWPTRPDFI